MYSLMSPNKAYKFVATCFQSRPSAIIKIMSVPEGAFKLLACVEYGRKVLPRLNGVPLEERRARADRIATPLIGRFSTLKICSEGMTSENFSAIVIQVPLPTAETFTNCVNLAPLSGYIKRYAGVFYGDQYERVVANNPRLKNVQTDRPHRVICLEILYSSNNDTVQTELVVCKTPENFQAPSMRAMVKVINPRLAKELDRTDKWGEFEEILSSADTSALSLKDEATSLEYSVKLGKSIRTCVVCGVTAIDMKKCGRCKNVHYCGAECQTKDWKTHKNFCK